MAKHTQTIITDDMDGTEGGTTVNFAFEGVAYEIDLSDANAERLRSELSPWIEKARPVRNVAKAPRNRRSASATDKEALAAMREWGRDNGFKVSDRGRVSAELQEAYAKAHS
ncbi:MAG: Lsr2 family protein [Propionibacteriaceae bacterium]|jgi:hypothetical protein|nr:Lsr2 family protein [Propionibacteriaceae bacterium]